MHVQFRFLYNLFIISIEISFYLAARSSFSTLPELRDKFGSVRVDVYLGRFSIVRFAAARSMSYKLHIREN